MKASQQVDGLDAGTDINALESAQGKVRNVPVDYGLNSAKLSYIAPDAKACFVDYSTDTRMLSPTRVSDGGGGGFSHCLVDRFEYRNGVLLPCGLRFGTAEG